jgi:hypothetical protein
VAQSSAQHIDIMNNQNRKKCAEEKKQKNQELNQSTIAWKIMILTNGFFFSSLPFPLDLRCFQFFRLLFVPFEETHIAPWRFLLASLRCFGSSNGFFQLPQKNIRRRRKARKIFSWLVELVHDCCGTQLLD